MKEKGFHRVTVTIFGQVVRGLKDRFLTIYGVPCSMDDLQIHEVFETTAYSGPMDEHLNFVCEKLR